MSFLYVFIFVQSFIDRTFDFKFFFVLSLRYIQNYRKYVIKVIIIIYICFISFLHELLCIYKKTNIYNNAIIGDFKIQNAI